MRVWLNHLIDSIPQSNAFVYHDVHMMNFTIPDDKYYLADVGYPICPQLLVCYCRTQYHLPEWDHTHIRYFLSFLCPLNALTFYRPTNSHEYFNLCHA